MAGLERSKWASPQAKAKLAQQDKARQTLDTSAPTFYPKTFASTSSSEGSPVQLPVDPNEEVGLGFTGHTEKPVADYNKGLRKSSTIPCLSYLGGMAMHTNSLSRRTHANMSPAQVDFPSAIAKTGSPYTSTSTEGLLKDEAAGRPSKFAKIKENVVPARAATGHARIAQLMSKRKPSSELEINKIEVKKEPDTKAGLLTVAFAAEKLAKEKAEADRVEAERLENERIAKAEAEAERRAIIQNDINAVDIELNRIKELEKFRVAEMTAEINALESETKEAKECQELLMQDRIHVIKLCELAKNDRDQAQIRVNTFTTKAEELKNDIEEATEIHKENVKTTEVMKEYDAANAAKYKEDIAELLQEKARLEYALNHPDEGLPTPPKLDVLTRSIEGSVTPHFGPQPDDAVDVPVVFDDTSAPVETVESTPSPTSSEGPSVKKWTAPKDPSLVVVTGKVCSCSLAIAHIVLTNST